LQSRLGDANIKEAQLISEKRILERRVAELRLAYDQQQKGLVDAASQALSYRQEILEENIRLTYALQVFFSYWLYICACVIELLNCVS
jgi:hypothetical protein